MGEAEMTRKWWAGVVLAGMGCGGNYQERSVEEIHSSIGFACAHAEITCDSCHATDAASMVLDAECLTCHEPARPASHDPAATATCSECHTECGWDAVSAHPPGYGDPLMHGIDFNLQRSSAGDCRDCHGTELTGAQASGCDTCHAQADAADWRTDCTFCHGGDVDQTGAPPHDLDRVAGSLSFAAHPAHVQPSSDYRAIPCSECHAAYSDALDEGHSFDDTPGVGEVDFSFGISPRATWDGQTCSSDGCHAMGAPDGSVAADRGPVQCVDCHGITAQTAPATTAHDIHLDTGDVTCQDCHASVVDATTTVIAPDLHPNGVLDIAFAEPDLQLVDGGCLGSCHGIEHDGENVGHPEGYDEPSRHGIDSLVGVSDCTSCHGADGLGGTSRQDCDECHEAGWRSDCAYCHGTAPDGLPPRDLDGTTNEEQISFRAHSEHDSGPRHPGYGCETCHGTATLTYSDAMLDPGHWFTPTPGVAEVTFTGIATGSYSAGTCSNNYCHGSGRAGGTESDGGNATALDCDACHASPPRSTQGNGTHQHRDHDHDRVTCDWCHDSVANGSSTIDQDALHVNGDVQVKFSPTANQWGGMSWNASTQRCTGECHVGGEDERHQGERWQ